MKLSSIKEKRKMLMDYNPLELVFHDEEYPCSGYTHTRNVARAFVMNEKNEIAILHVYGDDIFGHRDYYETPGGGVDEGEDFSKAVIRELDEEIGYHCEVLDYLGEVKDEYNLLKRVNINHYYLCKVVSKSKVHFESEGDKLIESIRWVSIENLKELYVNMPNKGVSKLVKQRELPFVDKLLCISNKN